MIEPKPCPFCNGKSIVVQQENKRRARTYIVECGRWRSGDETCPVSPDSKFYHTREEAIAAWNTRPLEDALQAKIDELTEARRKFHEQLDSGWIPGWLLEWFVLRSGNNPVP